MNIDFKKVVNNATATGLVAIVIVFIWYDIYQSNKELEIANAKIELAASEAKIKAAQELLEAQAKANKNSDIEILEGRARESSEASKDHMKTIEEARALIKSTEPKYETELLRSICYTNQITRKIDWVEYNLEYCKTDSNLEQFRTVK